MDASRATSFLMLLRRWIRESIRPVDWSRFAHGHDRNLRGSCLLDKRSRRPSLLTGFEAAVRAFTPTKLHLAFELV